MATTRTILHLDLDAFYCAVEEKRDSNLRGKAFAVGGPKEGRGVVSSCSYAARQFGVRSAMPMGRALNLCPNLICLPANFTAYRAASQEVMTRLNALTPLVEQISIDEAFLDVTGIDAPGRLLAERLQSQIWDELGLSCSLGIASNKLVAKIATDFGKSQVATGQSPQAICEVAFGTEAAFLAPLPASDLWGVGPKTAERLAELGMNTIGDIARWPSTDLAQRFGKHGVDLSRHARGIDDRLIVTERAAKSISRETTFARNVTDGALLRETVRSHVHDVSKQLQREGLSGTTVKLKIRWPDFTTVTRQSTTLEPTNQEAAIHKMALALFDQVWPLGQPVRLLGVGVGGFDENPQLNLWDQRPAEEADKERRIQKALEAVQSRLGDGSVRRGSDLKR